MSPGTWIAAAVLALVGCGGIGLSSTVETNGPFPTANEDAGAGSNGKGGSGGHGGGGGTRQDQASPPPPDATPGVVVVKSLCGDVGKAVCNPDVVACYLPDSDAGAGSCVGGKTMSGKAVCNGLADVTLTACRIGSKDLADCAPASDFKKGNQDGAACVQSSDCDIGYECVGDAKSGTCKHYCCDATTCDTLDSGSGPKFFCDIESAVGGQPVPVCTSQPSCAPLKDDCGAGLTCTIVDAGRAQTACVTYGMAPAGAECGDQKCAADLACIEGICRQLCNSSHACPAGDTCNSISGFSSLGSVGLCTHY